MMLSALLPGRVLIPRMAVPLPLLLLLVMLNGLFYVAVFRAAWKVRRTRTLTRRLASELKAERGAFARYREHWSPLIDAHCQAVGEHFADCGIDTDDIPILTAQIPPFYRAR